MTYEKGRIYNNPLQRNLGRFAVCRSVDETSRAKDILKWARTNEFIINQALNHQLGTLFTAEGIAEAANPNDEKCVNRQVQKIEAGIQAGALFTHVRLLDEGLQLGEDNIVGISKAVNYDPRDAKQKKDRPSLAQTAHMVDIRGIYTRPRIKNIALTNRGYALAQAHFVYSQFDPKQLTTAADYPYANPLVVPILRTHGFKIMESKPDKLVPFAGVKDVLLRRYYGPPCGELLMRLEAEAPWLENWKPAP